MFKFTNQQPSASIRMVKRSWLKIVLHAKSFIDCAPGAEQGYQNRLKVRRIVCSYLLLDINVHRKVGNLSIRMRIEA